MNADRLVVAILAVGLLAGASLAGAAAAGLGPVASIGSPLAVDEESKPHALVSFTTAGARCTDDFQANSSVSVAGGGPNTEVVYARNVSLPDPSHAIGGPTLERSNESAFALRVPVEKTEKPPRDCPGVARYEAGMRLPVGDDPWTVHVYHDGELVTTIQGDSERSGMGGSVSAGERVEG